MYRHLHCDECGLCFGDDRKAYDLHMRVKHRVKPKPCLCGKCYLYR